MGDSTRDIGMCHRRPYNLHWDVPWETLQSTLGCVRGDPTINRDWDLERRPHKEQTPVPAGETLQSTLGCAMGEPTINTGMCHGRPYKKHWDVPWETLQSTLGCAMGDPTINTGMCHGRPYKKHWDLPWESLQ